MYPELIEMILEMKRAYNLSFYDMAKNMEVSDRTLSNIVNGKNIQPSTMVKMNAFFNEDFEVEEMMRGDALMPPEWIINLNSPIRPLIEQEFFVNGEEEAQIMTEFCENYDDVIEYREWRTRENYFGRD